MRRPRSEDALGGLRLWVREVIAGQRTFDRIECAVGARGVVVRLTPERTVTAKVYFTGNARMEELDVQVRTRNDRVPGWSEPAQVTRTRRDGYAEVTVSRLRPGRHELAFVHGNRLAVRLRDVDMPADAPCTDPRLERVVVYRE